MKYRILTLFLFCTLYAVAAGYTFTIENPSPFDRPDQPVVLTVQQFGGSIPAGFPTATFRGKAVAVQSDDLNRDGLTDELALTLPLKAGEKADLKIVFNKKMPGKTVAPRVYAQMERLSGGKRIPVDTVFSARGTMYDSLQHHGPAFESEKLGVRVYFDKKQTLDFYGKKTPGLELAQSGWYPNDSMLRAGFGDDILLVGESLSVGTLRGWNGKKTVFLEPVAGRTARILSKGPVRTVVEMSVNNWKYQKQSVELTTRYILYAGHQDVEITHFAGADKVQALTFCTGVQKFPEMQTCLKNDVLAVWGRNWPQNDTLKYAKETVGLALYCPDEHISGKYREDNSNFLYLLKGFPVIRYWALVRWEKEPGGIHSSGEFFDILPRWKQSLTEPVLVRPKR